MAEAKRDQNRIPTLMAVSSADGTTPIALYADPTTHRLYVDFPGGGSGTVTSVSVVTANGISGSVADATTTPAITLTLGAITPSSVQVSGLTASELTATDASKNLQSLAVATYPSLTEISYVKGVTSAIQTQLNAKGTGDVTKVGTPVNNQVGVWTGDGTLEGDAALTFDTATDTLTTGTYNSTSLTASEMVITDGSKNLVSAAVATYPSLTELSYVKGVTSALQTQIDAKYGSGSSPSFATVTTSGGIELGHASDTTISRASAGVASIEGNNIVVNTSSPTLATITTTGNIELGHASDTTLSRSSAGVLAVEGVTVSMNSTSATHTAGTIELGAASDTTLSRASAGVLAVEGVNVLTVAGGTMTGSITLGENTGIALDPAGSADGKWTGITITGTAGYTQAFGDLVYLSSVDSRWELADADAASTADRMLAMVVVAGGSDGAACTLLLQGIIRADAKFPALTIGSAVYVGETAGAIQVAIPTGADNVIRRVGYALTADEIYFCPSMDSQITVA